MKCHDVMIRLMTIFDGNDFIHNKISQYGLYEMINGLISFGHNAPDRIAATVKTNRPLVLT